MVKVLIPNHLQEQLNDDEIKEIVQKSLGTNEYEIFNEDRGLNSGQYIKLQYRDSIKYILLSRDDFDSRNAFLVERFSTPYKNFIEEKNNNKSFECFIRKTDQQQPPYNIFTFKMLNTIGIKIINEDKLILPNLDYGSILDCSAFNNYEQFKNYRHTLQQRNSSNNSTQFEEDEYGNINVLGKTFGANGRETALICLTLSKLEKDMPINYIQVNERDIKHPGKITGADKFILESLGININDESIDFDQASEEIKDSRVMGIFHYNLMQKYGEKKCLLCGCNIEKMIQGAHIYSRSDIKKSSLPEEEKFKEMTDGNNGFWLCANHHLLFDYLLIYFKNQFLYASNEFADNSQELRFIKESIEPTYSYEDCRIPNDKHYLGVQIPPKIYTESMANYITKHRARFAR